MNDRPTKVMTASAALFMVVSLAVSPAAAQTSEVSRAWDGHPDLNGVWQAIGTAHWDIQDHPASAGPVDFGAIGRHPAGAGGGGRQRDPVPAVGPGAETAQL